jgi:hypothetical protein
MVGACLQANFLILIGHSVLSYSFRLGLSRESMDPFLTKWRGTSFEEKAVPGSRRGLGDLGVGLLYGFWFGLSGTVGPPTVFV